MEDYILFVDTETSGLPKKWNVPYNTDGNWPFSVQIAWIIYDRYGHEIKRENYYIYEEEIELEAASVKVHGITLDFLKENGVRRKFVLRKLAYDIKKYRPLMVSHFVEFDKHILNADFYRSKMDCPLENIPSYCTMLASKSYIKNPQSNFLRLAEFYDFLFGKVLEGLHDAIRDAEATASVFFELVRRGDWNDEKIKEQQKSSIRITKKNIDVRSKWWSLFLPI